MDTKKFTQPEKNPGFHLILPCSDRWADISLPALLASPISCGGAQCSTSLLSAAEVKFGVRLTKKPITCYYGKTSLMVMAGENRLNPLKTTTWAEIFFESSKGGRYARGVTIRPAATKDPELCPVRAVRLILKSPKRQLRTKFSNLLKRIAVAHGVDPEESQAIHYASLGQPNSLPLDSIIALSNSWGDGSPTATKSISESSVVWRIRLPRVSSWYEPLDGVWKVYVESLAQLIDILFPKELTKHATKLKL